MAILFVSTTDCIHKQSQNLLVSLKKRDVDFMFVCLENSGNAGFASAQFVPFYEMQPNGLMQYFTLKKYLKNHKVTHIHAFDEKALRLALWLKRSFPAIKIIGDWHERVLKAEQEINLAKNKEYPYLTDLTKNKFDAFFCTSPVLCHFLAKNYNLQNTLEILPYFPFSFSTTEPVRKKSALKKDEQKFVYFLHSWCEHFADIEIVFQAMKQLCLEENPENFYLFVCLEKDEAIAKVLALAEEMEIAPNLVLIGKQYFEPFYALADCVLCADSEGEGDYAMIHGAWNDEKVLIASDLTAHTKFVLSDSVDCALLYPHDDAFSLFKCLRKTLQDAKLRAVLIDGGRQKVHQNIANLIVNRYLKKINLL